MGSQWMLVPQLLKGDAGFEIVVHSTDLVKGPNTIAASPDSASVVDGSPSGRRGKIVGIIELSIQQSQGAFLAGVPACPLLPFEPGIFG